MTQDFAPQASPFSCNIDTPIIDMYVCLKSPNFLPSCTLSASSREEKKKEKTQWKDLGFHQYTPDVSQRSTALHCHPGAPFCTIRKSNVTWNFAVPVPHSKEIKRCILLFLCTLVLPKKMRTDRWIRWKKKAHRSPAGDQTYCKVANFRLVPIFVLLPWNWFVRTNFRTFEDL